MVNFAELKAKAEKAKDASVTKMTNTRDRYSSMPSNKVHWDPNWKRTPPGASASGSGTASAPPPPPPRVPTRSQPDVIVPAGPGAIDSPVSPSYTALPPPTRATSGYPPSHRDTPVDPAGRIDWAHLSAEDKVVFFEWLDEFFSRYLGIEVGPGMRASVPETQPARAMHQVRNGGGPPVINTATRPQA